MSVEANQVTEQKPRSLSEELTDLKPEVEKVLPAHVTPDKFMRVVMTAISQSPELYQADRRSLLTSCVKAAQDGLLPDGREAALVIFNTKDRATDRWVKKVQYMPMVAGILKKVRNSGELQSITSNVVYEHDTFDYWLDDVGEHITHKPNLMVADRGKMLAVYAIAKTKDGGVYVEVMTRSQIEQVKAVSKAKNGPWDTGWYDEMSRKTVIRRLSKRLPMSTDLEAVVTRDDEMYDFRRSEQQQISNSGVSAARALLGIDPKCDGNHGGPPCGDPECWATGDGETVDAQTGEVTGAEASEPQQADAIPQYDADSAVQALQAKRNTKTLGELYNEIAQDFVATGRELPEAVQQAYEARRAELEGAEAS